MPGKILPAPSVRYGPDRTVTKTPFGGSWNMDKTKVNVPTRLPPIVAPNGKKSPAWMAVCVNGADMKSVKVALPKFQAELARMGVDLNPPSPPAPLTAVDRIDGLRKDSGHSKELIARAMNMVKKAGTRLVLFVLPNKDVAIYNMIKQVGDSEVGLHTICVQHEHFTSPKHYFAVQYWANVGLKFNLKLGGGNQGILDLDMGILREEKTMLMGLDVTASSEAYSRWHYANSATASLAWVVVEISECVGHGIVH